MRFFTRMLSAILVLGAGFVLGVRFQASVESRSATRALIDIQKARITRLQQEAQRLRTALLLRDYLEETRLRIPRSTYRTMVDAIADSSLRYDVAPETILAVIRIESTFDTDARSEAGAVGLMQLLPSTAEEIARELRLSWSGDETLRDPVANIEMGTYYLTKLLGRFNDLAVALAAYNEGPGRVAGRAAEGATPTTSYAQKVLSFATP